MIKQQKSAMELSLITFGIVIGVVGILHGAAEVLRGNELVGGHSVEALPLNWPNMNFYSMTRGSPVFSLLTGLPFFALGLTAIFVSVALIAASIQWIRLNTLGVALFALMSVLIFLFGAGRGTPIAVSLPIVIGAVLSLKTGHQKARSDASKRKIWNGFMIFFALNLLSWMTFFPGLFLMSFYMPIPTWLFVLDFMGMPISTLGMVIFGVIYDRSA